MKEMAIFQNEKRNVASPFRRIVATGFYDGPTEGFAVGEETETCSFRLLDWDQGQDLRVFRIAAIPGVSLDDAVAVLRNEGPPSSPIWLLPAPLGEAAERFVQRANELARPVAIVVTRDLLGTLDLWRPITGEPRLTGSRDWLTELGFPREIND
jgi:hypothetical protein